jgi:hypothetical protein
MAIYRGIQNKMVLEALEEGDLVEFTEEICSHWGVYVGMY